MFFKTKLSSKLPSPKIDTKCQTLPNIAHTSGSRRVLPESPPSYEKEAASSYVGRSSSLKEESRRDTRELTAATKTKVTRTEAPGLYNNADDREGLRQMLSSLRRDPMDVEDDPDNNDGTFFPCEFCGDPYPCEYLMRHQVSRTHMLQRTHNFSSSL